ncbi:MAG: response regulator [Synergistaceae bacterium]|jgi:two-component system response regulator YesN|nr:response regulator [Synergistaceae bacterium]
MYKTLLVDDREVFVREIEALRVWGDASGFCVSARALDGVDALDCLRSSQCDLVITDIRMPRMDGIVLLRRIKEENLCPCVALLSEHSEFEYAQKAIVLGAFDYLVKPLNEARVQELLSRAGRFLSERAGIWAGLDRDARMDLTCTLCAEREMLSMIGAGSPRVMDAFERLSERIRRLFPPEDARFSQACRKIYSDVIAEIFKTHPWLGFYKSEARYEKPEDDARWHDGLARRAVAELLGFVDSLLPGGAGGTLRDICRFVLENPDSKINLQVISEKFFINRTYFSNMFHQKTGIHFNKYMTHVKLSRARFLLENSGKNIYEIGYCLGYSDFNYFNRIYKKFSEDVSSESGQPLAASK